LDGVWGSLRLPTFYKNEPAWGTIHPVNNSPLHCRRIPTAFPWDLMQPTLALTVEHYGYAAFEQATAKQHWYQEIDTVKDIRLIGTPNYEHLTDERTLQLLPYAVRSLAVVMLSHNEQLDTIARLQQLAHYGDEVLVVDTGSTDKTVELCKRLGIRVEAYRCCDRALDPNHLLCDFSKARNFAI